jgi:hypothetical protein
MPGLGLGVAQPAVIFTDVEVCCAVAARPTGLHRQTSGAHGYHLESQLHHRAALESPDDMRAVLGFVGKNIEGADQLLQAADRTAPARRAPARPGLAIIDTFIRLTPLSPPVGEGFDLATGEHGLVPALALAGRRRAPRVFLRSFTEDLRMRCAAIAASAAWGATTPIGWSGAAALPIGSSSSSARTAPSHAPGFRGRAR